ncbi:MAG: WG repeat-containing protein [Prevotella sp.]|nr:WG repeat-containing protein [Prevotella sp.]
MKKLKSLFIFIMLSALCCTSADAQGVFGQIKKGLNEAKNKGVSGSVKGVINSAADMVGAGSGKKNGSGKGNGNGNGKGNGNGNGNGSGGGNNDGGKKDEGPGNHPQGAGKWGNIPTVVSTAQDFCWLCVTPSYDGVFAIPESGSSSNKKWRFYKTEGGEPVTDKIWITASEPHFNGGVCAVCDPATKKWFVLKKDGTTIALAQNVTSVTNFLDGVAIASTSYTDHYYINDKGQRAYPNAKPYKAEIYPLIDGKRRLFQGKNSMGVGAYGFLDGHGNVVIKPQYSWARNFGSDVAVVYDREATKNKYWVINNMGNKVAEVPEQYADYGWTPDCNITEFINSATVVMNNETRKYDIISPTMQVKASYDYASPFCQKTMPGTAQVCVVKNDDWKHPRLCDTTGKVIDENYHTIMPYPQTDYIVPEMISLRPTQPWAETMNNKKEVTVRTPYIEENDPNTNEAWVIPRWQYTGYCLIGGGTTDYGWVMDYEGLVRMYNAKYEQPDAYSMDGYAKAIKKSTAGWRLLVSTWVEDLEEHMVFVDKFGKPVVEVISNK